ncbi:hypothetical protein D7Z94_25190 [Ulvibacterium marinum]|uniref:Uncharacterized protein n=2 Tax=Ulvibacterium marinum TaxID=2419782 RepID=A0A3B0BQP1_9FLAO|nr:hypothetical protein D7Z94_25190 [Ulvibacterium marinum]
MYLGGDEFIQTQRPIDFAHWLLLIGSISLVSFNYIFPKSILNSIASVLTVMGIIAHVAMSSIDFVFWSFRNDYDGLVKLIRQLENEPSIWLPFMVIGPSLLFIGLAIHAFTFIKKRPISSLLVIVGSIMIGMSSFLWRDRIYIIIAHLVFALGLTLLCFNMDERKYIRDQEG